MPTVGLPLFGEPEPSYYTVSSEPLATAAGKSSAQAALRGRSAKVERLRELWRSPRTMHGIAQETGWPLASVCSLKSCIEGELVAVATFDYLWPDGRITKRTVWQRADCVS